MKTASRFFKAGSSVIALAASITISGGISSAIAQTGVDADEVEDVVISIGSRRADRSAATTIAPVDVIGASELNNQGDVDLVNLLRTSVPSYNANEQPISDAATLVRPANLRGLAPDSTLVLVNGKRRHRAAVIAFLGGGISDGAQGPDIGVIPAIALKQVEVLRDGAASQYGSDAIAGVINFALRDNTEGFIVEGQYGSTYEGDGDQYRIAANLGLPVPLAQGGFLNLSAEFSEVDDTNRSVQRDDGLALIAAGNTAVTDISVNTVTTDVIQIWGQPEVDDDFVFFGNSAIQLTDEMEIYAFGNYAERRVEGGFFFRNPTNRAGVFQGPQVNPATGNLVNSVETTTEGIVLSQLVDSVTGLPVVGGTVNSVSVGDLDGLGTGGSCPAGIPLTGTDGLIPDSDILAQITGDANCFSFVEIFPGGFVPRFGGDLQDSSIVAGVRGELPIGAGLTYDFSFTHGRNVADFFINNTINASLGPDTPLNFDPGTYIQADQNFNVDFSYPLANDFFASDINLAFGFEHRRESFTILAGDEASFQLGPLATQGFASSSNGFGGFNASNAGTNSQRNYALYFDTEADITDALTVQAAVRYEDFYDSFGDTLNYKVGALYNFNDVVTLRGTWSTGFHAPTAGQANVSNVTTAFAGAILVDQGTLPLNSAAGQLVAGFLESQTGFTPTLGPEDSQNLSVGLGFSLANINFTVDYFRIEVEDRIAISDQQDFGEALAFIGAQNGVAVDSNAIIFDQLTTLDNAGVINIADFAGSEDLTSFGFFTNSFDTRTQGIDVVASSDYEFYAGSSTNVALVFNWTDTVVTDDGEGSSAAPISFGRARQLEDNIPAVRGNISFNHRHGPFRALARVNYFGSFFECHLDSVNDDEALGGCDLPIEAGSQITVDLEAGWQLTDNFEISVGARNAFDSDPDENPFAGIVGAQFPTTAPNGFNGGSYYFRVRAEF